MGSSQGKPVEQEEGVITPVGLQNITTEHYYSDVLHKTAKKKVTCGTDQCSGSIMNPPPTEPLDELAPISQVMEEAVDFINQYYEFLNKLDSEEHLQRVHDVTTAITQTGTYHMTTSELTFGARTSWRNAARCIGRNNWTKLHVFDCRDVNNTHDMFAAICRHLEYTTNGGRIRPAMSVFPQRERGRKDFRVWNVQLITYAGYKQPDGSVIGDPANVGVTEVAMSLGWKGEGGMFDILPLILQAPDEPLALYEIPPHLALEVEIEHPEYDWFADMGLKWFAVPAVSGMMMDCGGQHFTALPFSGWYMGTEVGARDFCDVQRYNLTKEIADRMGLDTKRNASLWRDKAVVETNIAVLHSFERDGVTMQDHHTLSENFMKHFKRETKQRGGCPADWIWIVPPISGSLTNVFHQEMMVYHLKPQFLWMDSVATAMAKEREAEEQPLKAGEKISKCPFSYTMPADTQIALLKQKGLLPKGHGEKPNGFTGRSMFYLSSIFRYLLFYYIQL